MCRFPGLLVRVSYTRRASASGYILCPEAPNVKYKRRAKEKAVDILGTVYPQKLVAAVGRGRHLNPAGWANALQKAGFRC